MRQYLIDSRNQKGMSQQKVADSVGISRTHYTQIENSKRNPSVGLAKKIAELFGFEWTIFFNNKVTK